MKVIVNESDIVPEEKLYLVQSQGKGAVICFYSRKHGVFLDVSYFESINFDDADKVIELCDYL